MTEDTQLRLGEAQTLVVRTSTAQTLEVDSTWQPSAKPPPMHWHPDQDEHFVVTAGELTVEIGDEPPRVIAAGGVLDVVRRTPHRMWNAGPDVTTATWTITPALRTEALFGYMSRGTGGLRGPLMLARFRNEFRLGRPKR